MIFSLSIIIGNFEQYHTLRKIKVYFVRKLFLGGPSLVEMSVRGFVSNMVMFHGHTKSNRHRVVCEMCLHLGIPNYLFRCHKNVKIE